MLRLLRLLAVLFTRLFRSRRDLLLENLALRQQLSVFERKHPQPRLIPSDKFSWVTLLRALARMEARINSRRARDRCSLASEWIQALLDVALAASEPYGKNVRKQRTV